MVLPVQLITGILKFTEVSDIINFSLINEDTFITYCNNKDYIARIKLKECGMQSKSGTFYIYTKIKIFLQKGKVVNYSNILSKNAKNGLQIVKFLVRLFLNKYKRQEF